MNARGFDSLGEKLAAFPPRGRYLVGVSGGRDSVALLHWLVTHGYRRLIVCHLDHGLRGRAARADAEFVRRLAKRWKLDCEIAHVDVSAIAAEQHLSPEAAARAARFEFFQKTARRRRCRIIFLAHHADDQVETFLLQLFRGAGGRGLGAMREISRVGTLVIVRPLLGVWRSEIDEYVTAHRLRFREDASNAQPAARRNRLRHDLVPELEKKFGRALRKNLWRAAHLLAEEDAFLETLLPNECANTRLAVKALRALPLALQRRVILRWLREQEVRGVGFEVVESIRALLAPGAKVARVNLPENRFVRRRAGELFLE